MEYVSIPLSEYRRLLQSRELVEAFETMLHEEKFNTKFVKEVIDAKENVKQGKCVKFRSKQEMRNYFERS